MKRFRLFIAILFLVSMSFAQNFKYNCVKIDNFKTPESANIYKNRFIFVSNVNGNPTLKDGNGYISLLDLKTNSIYPKFLNSLDAPKGISTWGDYLFTADIDSVKVFSISKRKLINIIKIPKAKFLNDITIDPISQILYVSDTEKDTIYTISLKNFKVTKLLHIPGLSPNGLFFKWPYLFIASWQGGTIYILNLNNKILRPLFEKHTFSNLDGIVVQNNIIYFSDWNLRENPNNGKLYAFDLKNKKLILIFDHLKGPADIDISGNVLTIPEFLGNDVLICYFHNN